MRGTAFGVPVAWLRPEDGPDVVYEFFSPFAHVEGRYEWCRIRSPTHGVFDAFILLAQKPAVVFVNAPNGQRFMVERYPEVETYRVSKEALRITESDGGRTIRGRLRSRRGPLRSVEMRLAARRDATPGNVPYGGNGAPVWGSRRFTCWGVDLVLRARADGRLVWSDGRIERLAREPALVTLGSFGRIAPLPG